MPPGPPYYQVIATYDEKAVFTSPLLPGLRLKAASVFKSPLQK